MPGLLPPSPIRTPPAAPSAFHRRFVSYHRPPRRLRPTPVHCARKRLAHMEFLEFGRYFRSATLPSRCRPLPSRCSGATWTVWTVWTVFAEDLLRLLAVRRVRRAVRLLRLFPSVTLNRSALSVGVRRRRRTPSRTFSYQLLFCRWFSSVCTAVTYVRRTRCTPVLRTLRRLGGFGRRSLRSRRPRRKLRVFPCFVKSVKRSMALTIC